MLVLKPVLRFSSEANEAHQKYIHRLFQMEARHAFIPRVVLRNLALLSGCSSWPAHLSPRARCGERVQKTSTCDGCDGRCWGKSCHQRSPSPVREIQVHSFDWPYCGGAVCRSAALISTSMKMYALCSKKTGGVTTCQKTHKQGYLEHRELYILKCNIPRHLVSFSRWGLANSPLVPHLAAPLQKVPR